MYFLDEQQRHKHFMLARSSNIKALQKCRRSTSVGWDALVAIQAARANDWTLLSWVLHEELPTELTFSECRFISDREVLTVREALYVKTGREPPPRVDYLLPTMREAFARRARGDEEIVRRRGDPTNRLLMPCEYVFMEQDAATAAFLQGHLDMMNWLLQRDGGRPHPGHALLRHDIIIQAMAVPAPLHSIEWILTQGTFKSSNVSPAVVVEVMVMAAKFERYDYLRMIGQHYGVRLGAERKEQVMWHLCKQGTREAVSALETIAIWHQHPVPHWPESDEEEEEDSE